MQHFESRTGVVLLLVRLGLAVYLIWSGVITLLTHTVWGAGFIALGAILLLGIVRRLVALLVVGVLVMQYVFTGIINPAIAMAVLIAVALLLGPSH